MSASEELEFYFAMNDPTLVITDEALFDKVRLAITEGIGNAKRIIAISSPMEPGAPFDKLFKELQ